MYRNNWRSENTSVVNVKNKKNDQSEFNKVFDFQVFCMSC